MRKIKRVPRRDELRRLNVQVTQEELGLLRLSADLFAEGNMSRLIRFLAMSVLPQSYEGVNRETIDIPLQVVQVTLPPTPLAQRAAAH